MSCPHCQSLSVVKNGMYSLKDGSQVQPFLGKDCGKRFSDQTGTPMARLRTPVATVSLALKLRGEGMGVRASSRVLKRSHSTILRWEARMASQAKQWSPPAPDGSEVTLEHDALYTRVGENLSPL
jgi:transposase-like protein